MPDVSTSVKQILVVEGFINLTDSTKVKLSRTVDIQNKGTTAPELDATVTIENDKGVTFALPAKGNGVYAAQSYNLSAADRYRLRIVTKSGAAYLSDLVQAKVSPPIDSVGTRIQANGVYLNISTHDLTNATHYYRWEYYETWEFNTFLRSEYYYDGVTVLPRTFYVNHCWGNNVSPDIHLASTLALTNDVVDNKLLLFIDASSEKLTQRYSILVKQYPLTIDAYEYYEQLKAATEKLGTVFDPMPSSSFGEYSQSG
ncbi:hypothetical protein GCM10028827_28730 [Mucilaginibacter myungsuensis]|nr:DUF4249 domain-containing protein [Mucilaginibacter myungsuensis]MDN3599067.1 DUF4249 domain-containing protein [Mucilaginibacter myungsuensis]